MTELGSMIPIKILLFIQEITIVIYIFESICVHPSLYGYTTVHYGFTRMSLRMTVHSKLFFSLTN